MSVERRFVDVILRRYPDFIVDEQIELYIPAFNFADDASAWRDLQQFLLDEFSRDGLNRNNSAWNRLGGNVDQENEVASDVTLETILAYVRQHIREM